MTLFNDELNRTVDEAGIDSFPASDPPGWWAGTTDRKILANEEVPQAKQRIVGRDAEATAQ